ncbi:hypothetical protein GMOD_00000894 [Pyrenophora seminiperda CCB06]|uniref:Uncharacterized protein n=1 Tax=Pyrenophora seminiperda CCB06 TaxID=1302712 RepID=A0A3M7M8P5_9PLEO|nr:hypothetical protein GMOD_00000894 [Pyrenophora seminiperda CCB06]
MKPTCADPSARTRSSSTEQPGWRGTPPATPAKRRKYLSWSDFQDDGPIEQPEPTLGGTLPTPFAITKSLMTEECTRFQRGTPIDFDSDICCPPDRFAVINLYNTALSRISPDNHLDIYTEAKSKIKIILGMKTARYTNAAFTEGLLPPLEPMYAEPRIEYSEDPYRRHAHWRLNAWRKEKWPLRLPKKAIKMEEALMQKEASMKKKSKGGRLFWDLEEVDWEDQASAGWERDAEKGGQAS